MRKDTRFARPDRSDIEAKLPPGTLDDAQALGIWNMMLRASDPSEVCHLYRSYRDSRYSAVPKPSLRAMRDTMITSMREANRKDTSPRKEKKAGIHYQKLDNLWQSPRKGA
jgi:hypothetical protein